MNRAAKPAAAGRGPRGADGVNYRPSFPIVGLGASAGGLDAYKTFLGAMPSDSGLAFVLVQHLAPNQESLMVDLLSKCTAMPVNQAEDGRPVEPNHVYMIPPNRSLTIERGRLRLAEPVERRGRRMAIDTFFRALAEDQRERAVGVVLSGTGTDGAQGITAIKAHGGLTLVQQPDTAAHDGMPRAALKSGQVDRVCRIDEMPDVLVRYADHPHVNGDRERAPLLPESVADGDLNAILALLLTRRGVDFRHYKRATLARRVERRMGLNHVGTPAEYLALLRERPDEAERLGKDLMIGVTSFFRDPEAWSALAEHALRPLIATAAVNATLRVWVPGCATGEEAYTIAILAAEQIAAQGKTLTAQVFASDIDETALEIARAGYYPTGSAADLSAERLEAYFEQDDDRLQIKKTLRESVVFARQDLITDPPFSRLDLISCRNLLIYLQQPVQEKLIRLFHFALKPDGALLLGGSESVGRETARFTPLVTSQRLYRRRDLPLDGTPSLPLLPSADGASARRQPGGGKTAPRRPRFAEIASRWVLEAFAPATAIINRRGDALFFCGPVGRYLDYPYGEANLNLFDIAREELGSRLRRAVAQAYERGEPLVVARARMRADGAYRTVRLQLRPLEGQSQADALMMVSFHDVAAGHENAGAAETRAEASDDGYADPGLVRQLEDELRATKHDLQTTVEEMESSNEELKASNEEAMSINEELQSTNEELETSKEELQSLNEELTTVNNQLADKVDELERATNDITNLLNSTDIATLFLDSVLRIKRFTPAVRQLFNLLPADLGRPLTDLAGRINDPALLDDARRVLGRLAPVETDVEGEDGRWFTRRVLPYRTRDDKIDGVVVTFSDVTRLRDSERVASEHLARLETVFRETPIGLCLHDRELRYTLINPYLSRLNGVTVDAHLGRTPREVLPATLGARVEKLLRRVLDEGRAITDVEAHGATPREPGVKRDWWCNYFPIVTAAGETIGVSSMVQEITAHKQAERRAATARTLSQLMLDGEDFDAAVADLLGVFNNVFGVEVGEFWVPLADDPQRLCCRTFRLLEPPGSEIRTRRYFDETTLGVNDGLIGRTWQNGRARWTPDVGADDAFERADKARELGLTTAFAFPVVQKTTGQKLGVVALYSRARLPEDPALLPMLDRIGQELGELKRRLDAEREAQRRGREYKALADHLPNIVARFDRGYRYRYVNPAVSAMTGRPPEDFIGRRVRELDMPPALSERWESMIDQVFAGAPEAHDEFAFDTPDGRRYYQSRLVLEPNDGGEIEHVLAVTTDITARRRVEAALAERERRLERALQELDTLYDTAPAGLCVLDRERRFVKINQHLASLTGRPVEEHLSRPAYELYPALHEMLEPIIAEVFDAKRPIIDREVAARLDADRPLCYWRISCVPLTIDERGEVGTVSCTVMEISALKRSEQAMQRARSAADAANRSKSEFLANMSHEIRSPLTAILGYADVLTTQTEDRDVLDSVNIIRVNGRHLLGLLNDFLDLAKIESGKLSVELKPIAPDQLVDEVIALMAVRAEEKSLALTVDYRTPVPATVQTDPIRLRQILINLIGNAVKFTRRGEVRLAVSLIGAPEPRLRFDVIDTGIGLTRSQRQTLFEPFTQADTSGKRSYGGSGLGLTISRRLAQLLGGDVTVDSRPRRGSTFSLTVATGAIDGTALIEPGQRSGAGAGADEHGAPWPTFDGRPLVLVVDDRTDIRTLMRHYLERAGARVVTADNGEAALAAIERTGNAKPDQAFDAVIMDMQMPTLDGYDTVRRLRDRGFAQPIVAVTAAALTGERDKCLAAGCSDYLTKPIDGRRLVTTLAARLTATPRRVLLVDDNADALRVTAKLLDLAGFRTLTAADGESALKTAAGAAVDAVVLDIGLPDTDGYELATRLRQLPGYRDVSLIALSGHAPDAGQTPSPFDHHLIKPPELAELRALLENSAPRRRKE